MYQDAVQWLFEVTVGWLIDKILDGLGLRKFIDDFINTILEKLGITAMKNSLSAFFESTMESVCTPFKDIADATDLKSIAFIVKEVRWCIPSRSLPLLTIFSLLPALRASRRIPLGRW